MSIFNMVEVRARYRQNRDSAHQRGVAFLLTFKQWWALWEPHWEQRERRVAHLCRTGDTGPYAVGNVRICTAQENRREQAAR